MTYYSSYMAPIKKADVPAYRETARETSAIFKELGALEVSEFLADEVVLPDRMVGFAQSLQCASDETVIFGWVAWPSKEVLDACNAELQKNPRPVAAQANFDVRRLIAGNFRTFD